MDIAALVSFAILLVGWIAAPDRPRRPERAMTEVSTPEPRPSAA
jgi:hypothetical protein